MSLTNEILRIARKAKEDSQVLANLPTSTKNAALEGMAEALIK